MYRRILVTGGTGTVGGTLQLIKDEYPQREFFFIGSKDCNLLDLETTKNYIKANKCDAILHLAAVSGGIELSMKYPATLLRDNVLININILEATRLCNINKILMTLSTGMYPANVPNPILEEYIHNGYPHESNYAYAFAKRLVDPLIKAYRTEYGMKVIGVIPNAILGERSNFSYSSSTMVPALIRRFYENKEGDSKIIVLGDGSPLREITYANDIAKACMWCLDNYDSEQILHIGTTEEHSVKEIAYMIADIMEIDRDRIVFDATKPSGQLRKNTDNSKFLKISNFKYTPFRIGLEKTIEWFCKNYPNSEKLRL